MIIGHQHSVLASLRTAGSRHGGIMARQLPSHPDLEQLKRQAKELQASAGIPLHEAQTRLARDYGFASWNKLREEVEARTLEFDAAVTEFIEAATDGRPDPPRRMLELHPKIRAANLYTALVLGDADAVRARLDKDPALATRTGGPRGWEPIHHGCHTAVGGAGLADIARPVGGPRAPARRPRRRSEYAIPVAASRRAPPDPVGRIARDAIAAARHRPARGGRRSQ